MKKNLRKILALTLAALLLFAFVAACADNDDPPPAATPAPPPPDAPPPATDPEPQPPPPRPEGVVSDHEFTLEFWSMPTHANEEATLEWLNPILDQFYVAYPGATVNFTLVPWTDAATNLTLALSTGHAPPDVHYTFPEQVWEFASAGWIVPIDEWFPDKDDFLGLDDCSWAGNFYMAPILYSVSTWIYNTNILDQIGWDVNNLPETMDEFEAYLRQAKDNGVYGAWMNLGNMYVLNGVGPFWWSTGVDYIMPNDDIMIDDPVFANVLSRIASWIDDDLMPREAIATLNATPHMIDGEAGATFLHASFLNLEEYQQTFTDWVIGPAIRYNASATPTGLGIACGFVMTKYCEEPDAAAYLIRLMTDYDAQISFNEVVGFMPARKSVPNIFGDRRGFEELTALYASLPQSFGGAWNYKTGVALMSLLAEEQKIYLGEVTLDAGIAAIRRLLEDTVRDN